MSYLSFYHGRVEGMHQRMQTLLFVIILIFVQQLSGTSLFH